MSFSHFRKHRNSQQTHSFPPLLSPMSTILDSLALSSIFSSSPSNIRPALRPSPPLSATWDRRSPLKYTAFKSCTPLKQVSLSSSSTSCCRSSSVSGEASDVAFDGSFSFFHFFYFVKSIIFAFNLH